MSIYTKVTDLININSLYDKLVGCKRSFTIWFNSLLLAAIPLISYAQDNLTQLKDIIPDNFYHYALIAVAVGNLVLRFKTNSDLKNK